MIFGSYVDKWWPISTNIMHHDFHASFSNHFILNVREIYNYWKPVDNFLSFSRYFERVVIVLLLWVVWRSYVSWFPLKRNAVIFFWLCCLLWWHFVVAAVFQLNLTNRWGCQDWLWFWQHHPLVVMSRNWRFSFWSLISNTLAMIDK